MFLKTTNFYRFRCVLFKELILENSFFFDEWDFPERFIVTPYQFIFYQCKVPGVAVKNCKTPEGICYKEIKVDSQELMEKKVEKKPEMQRVNFFGKAQSGELKSFSFKK